MVFGDPPVYVFQQFLSDEEVVHLMALADGKYERSLTSKGTAEDKQSAYAVGASETRTSLSARLPYGATELVRGIEERAAYICGMPLEHIEQLMVVRYKTGQYFKEHHDGTFRTWTILLYLNDIDSGGETEFTKIGVSAHPFKGGALMWPNALEDGTCDLRTLHEAKSQTSDSCSKIYCELFCKSRPRSSLCNRQHARTVLEDSGNGLSKGVVVLKLDVIK
eukprot:Platyproteum_vivax@DN7003_c0_g2_i2.p2